VDVGDLVAACELIGPIGVRRAGASGPGSLVTFSSDYPD
jgi:hypothetical protein